MPKQKPKNNEATSLSPGSIGVVERLFAAPVEQYIRRAVNGQAPQTALLAMNRDVDRIGKELGGERIAAFFAELIEMLRNAPEPLPPVTTPKAKTRIQASVCKVFDQLDGRYPYGTIALLACGVGIGRPRHAEISYETTQLAAAVSQLRGERRALRLADFARHVLENEYGPFLHTLLQAAWLAEGKPFKKFTSIGLTLNEVKHQGLLGQDLWLEAARVRNSTAHGRRSWRPDLKRKSVVLRDEKHGSMVELGVNALYKQLVIAVKHTTTLDFVLTRAFDRDLHALLGPALVRALKTQDSRELDQLWASFVARYQQTCEAMLARGWTLAG